MIVEVLTLQEVEVPCKLLVLTVQHLQGVADLLQVLLRPAQALKHKDTSSEYSSGLIKQYTVGIHWNKLHRWIYM